MLLVAQQVGLDLLSANERCPACALEKLVSQDADGRHFRGRVRPIVYLSGWYAGVGSSNVHVPRAYQSDQELSNRLVDIQVTSSRELI